MASDATGTLTINKAAATVVLNGLTQTYDGTPRVVTATTTPAGLTVDITYDGSATAPTNAGSYAIAATVNDPNYEGSTTGTLVVNKADQTIAFAALADKTFGDADFSVSATATSGLAVSFAASGKCTVTVDSVHLTGAGSCSITATRPVTVTTTPRRMSPRASASPRRARPSPSRLWPTRPSATRPSR